MSLQPQPIPLDEALSLLKQLALNDQALLNPTVTQLMQLLCARKRSLAEDDRRFDGCMFEIGKQLDEQVRDGAPPVVKKRFDLLTDYFHKLEAAAAHLNHLAFMGSSQLDVELLVELKQYMELFDGFKAGFFHRLFLEDLLKSQLLDSYGRRRIKVLVDGLAEVHTVKMQKSDMKFFDLIAVQAIITRLQQLEKEERLFMLMAEIVAEHAKLNQASLSTPQGREVIQRVTLIELRKRHEVEGEIPDSLFQKAFELVKLEAIYSNAVLPQVLRGNKALRQDFINKSGLDLFYIEDLEAQYCDRNGISRETLEQVRAG